MPINCCNQVFYNLSDVQGNSFSVQTLIDAYSAFAQIQTHNFVSFTIFKNANNRSSRYFAIM